MEYLEIGPCPHEEDCAQVGPHDYLPRMKAELLAFKHQLQRAFPEPDNGYVAIKFYSHDFGRYGEVVVKYDPDDEKACEWAYKVEGETPAHWDAEACAELAAAGFAVEVNHD